MTAVEEHVSANARAEIEHAARQARRAARPLTTEELTERLTATRRQLADSAEELGRLQARLDKLMGPGRTGRAEPRTEFQPGWHHLTWGPVTDGSAQLRAWCELCRTGWLTAVHRTEELYSLEAMHNGLEVPPLASAREITLRARIATSEQQVPYGERGECSPEAIRPGVRP